MSYKTVKDFAIESLSVGSIIGVVYIVIGMVIASVWYPIWQLQHKVIVFLSTELGWWIYPILFVFGLVSGLIITFYDRKN
jgi:ribose/xylose/arabinose/galactoside ABC-type transport system permease subunit